MSEHSRRQFLQALGLTGLGLAGCDLRSAPAAQPQTPVPVAGPPDVAPPARSRVVIARDRGAIAADGRVDAARVQTMLEAAMLSLAGGGPPQEAWRRYAGPPDVVALKVNALAGPELSTHPEVCHAIVTGLVSAGVAADKTIIYDRDSQELEALGFEPNTTGPGTKVIGSDVCGYDVAPTVVKSVGTCFSRIVSETATVLINVPVLKDHDLAGLSGALKNHFGSIHNPNKLHLDHCTPYVADLNCAELIRSKQRLVVVDALNVCYEGGPAYKPDTTVRYGALIVATDAVAADAVGLAIIEDLRRGHGLPPLAGEERAPRYLALAAEYGLGNARRDRIEIVRLEVGGGAGDA